MARFVMVLGLVLLGSARASAQGDAIYLSASEEKPPLEHEKLVREAARKAEAEAKLTPELQKSVELVVKYHVYRITMQNVEDTPNVLAGLVINCERWITDIVFFQGAVTNPPLQQAFQQAMVKELDRVLKNPEQRAIIRVNAARILSRLGQHSGLETTADLLVTVLTDPQQVEGARYYACQGLKGVMQKAPRTGPGIKDPERRAKVVTALVGFIERKPPYRVLTQDQADGLRVLRREAVRALAEVRDPLIAGQANGHAALCLCRVVARDVSLSPEPRLDEQVEAAVGLARMPADPQKEYQPGYTAFFLGQFVVKFVQAHKERSTNPRIEPWLVYAARLNDALVDMARAFPELEVKSILDLSVDLLVSIEQKRDANPNALSNHLNNSPPTARSVYKSDDKSVVTVKASRP
jgi:hypothetical protein